MHIDFQLTSPGARQEEHLREVVSSSWVFATLGSYSISASGQKLFQYHSWFRDLLIENNPAQTGSDCVLDYVAKLYLSLIRVLPNAMEEVPSDLTHYLSYDKNEQWEAVGREWYDEAERRFEPDDPRWDTYGDAMEWRSARMIDCDHLAQGPQIWIWRKDNQVSLEWDNQHVIFEGKLVYTAELGSELNSISEFVKSLEEFESRLLNCVFPCEQIPLTDIRLTSDREKAIAIRNQILKTKERYLAPAVTDWNKVRVAVNEIMK
jgi:Family of unknown function (DUF5984)